MTMKLAVNARYRDRAITGVERYAVEITRRLASEVEYLAPQRPLSGLRGHCWEQAVLPTRFRGNVLWSPCNTGPLAVRRQVLTLHDCAFVDHPECFTRFFAAWYQWLLPRLARRVAHVLTVSEFSRQRIIERLRVAPERVTAIANGVDARFQPQSSAAVAAMRERLGLPERYVLSVGSLEPRKNLPRLLAAWQQVATSHDDVSLVLVGGSNSNTFRAAGLAAPPPRVLHAGYVAHDDLPLLYSGSTLFVYPSLYEGFGLPVLEAMACGAPVICSRTTALPEVAGDAARFVDPLDIEALAASLHELLSDPPGCAALAALGPARARLFTWEAAAQATAHQLERVALA